MAQSIDDKQAIRFRQAFVTLYFCLAGGLVLAISSNHILSRAGGIEAGDFWRGLIIAAAVLSAALLVGLKVRSRLVWEAVFTGTLFLGVWYVLLLLLPIGWALLLAAALTLLQAFVDRIWSHDLFYLFGPVGLALSLASWLPPEAVLAGLVGLVTYDIVAGPPRRPILDLARSLVRQGIVPGLMVPGSGLGLLATVSAGIQHPDAALLGAGDLAIPLIVVALAAFSGILQGFCVLSGLILGAWFLGLGKSLVPRPALPFLALGAGLPFCLLYIFGLI